MMPTPYNHLTDHELVRLVTNWPFSKPAMTHLEQELAARLANAVDTLEEAHRTSTWPVRPSGICRNWCPCKQCEHNGRYGSR